MKVGDKYLCISQRRRYYYRDLNGVAEVIRSGDIITILAVNIASNRIDATEILVNGSKVNLLGDDTLFFCNTSIEDTLTPLCDQAVNRLLRSLNREATKIHEQMNRLKINYQLTHKE